MKWLPLLLLIFLGSACSLAANQMPEDMPEDFGFSVQFGINKMNEINTFESRITKDLIADGTAETDFTFTDEEMQEIYEMMKAVNIAEDKKLTPSLFGGCFQEPHEEDEWNIRLDGETIIHSVSEEYCDLTDDAVALFQLRNEIFRIVKEKEEYKSLPEAVGGYD